jgi:hypothetical protein
VPVNFSGITTSPPPRRRAIRWASFPSSCPLGGRGGRPTPLTQGSSPKLALNRYLIFQRSATSIAFHETPLRDQQEPQGGLKLARHLLRPLGPSCATPSRLCAHLQEPEVLVLLPARDPTRVSTRIRGSAGQTPSQCLVPQKSDRTRPPKVGLQRNFLYVI